MDLWYPNAKRTLTYPSGCGPHVFGPYRGVLHTTETPIGSISGVVNGYKTTHAYPHFTVDGSVVEQHVPLNAGSTALVHNAGTTDTNRASAIQIEIVGQASDPPIPVALAPLMRWIEQQTGIQWAHPLFTVRPPRFTDSAWRTFNGWCGHEHVPNQEPTNHWDPGAIDIEQLKPRGAELGKYNPPITMEPWVDDLNPIGGGGTWGLAADGSVYAVGGAPFFGGASGKIYFAGRTAADLVRPNVIEAANGKHYVIVDTVGERYAYPE